MMRANEKHIMSVNGDNQLFGMNFQHTIDREKEADSLDLPSEFSVSLNEMKRIKKRLERS
jgi:hypothetical protein